MAEIDKEVYEHLKDFHTENPEMVDLLHHNLTAKWEAGVEKEVHAIEVSTELVEFVEMSNDLSCYEVMLTNGNVLRVRSSATILFKKNMIFIG